MGEERKISDKLRSGRPLKITEDDEKEIRGFIDENDPQEVRDKRFLIYDYVELQMYFATAAL